MSLKKKYEKKIISRIINHMQVNLQKVNPDDFELGQSLWNRRCHLNAVQAVKEGKSNKIYLCLAKDKDDANWVCVHFINGTEDNKYIDNTWGWLHEGYEYYIIREVQEKEYSTIWTLLTKTKKSLLEDNSNSFITKILNISEEIL